MYERHAIERHLSYSDLDPITRTALSSKQLTPVYILRSRAIEYREHRSAAACCAETSTPHMRTSGQHAVCDAAGLHASPAHRHAGFELGGCRQRVSRGTCMYLDIEAADSGSRGDVANEMLCSLSHSARACTDAACSSLCEEPVRYLRRAAELCSVLPAPVQGLSKECIQYVQVRTSHVRVHAKACQCVPGGSCLHNTHIIPQ